MKQLGQLRSTTEQGVKESHFSTVNLKCIPRPLGPICEARPLGPICVARDVGNVEPPERMVEVDTEKEDRFMTSVDSTELHWTSNHPQSN